MRCDAYVRVHFNFLIEKVINSLIMPVRELSVHVDVETKIRKLPCLVSVMFETV